MNEAVIHVPKTGFHDPNKGIHEKLLDPTARLQMMIDCARSTPMSHDVPLKRWYAMILEAWQLCQDYMAGERIEKAYILVYRFAFFGLHRFREHRDYEIHRSEERTKFEEIHPTAVRLESVLRNSLFNVYVAQALYYRNEEEQRLERLYNRESWLANLDAINKRSAELFRDAESASHQLRMQVGKVLPMAVEPNEFHAFNPSNLSSREQNEPAPLGPPWFLNLGVEEAGAPTDALPPVPTKPNPEVEEPPNLNRSRDPMLGLASFASTLPPWNMLAPSSQSDTGLSWNFDAQTQVSEQSSAGRSSSLFNPTGRKRTLTLTALLSDGTEPAEPKVFIPEVVLTRERHFWEPPPTSTNPFVPVRSWDLQKPPITATPSSSSTFIVPSSSMAPSLSTVPASKLRLSDLGSTTLSRPQPSYAKLDISSLPKRDSSLPSNDKTLVAGGLNQWILKNPVDVIASSQARRMTEASVATEQYRSPANPSTSNASLSLAAEPTTGDQQEEDEEAKSFRTIYSPPRMPGTSSTSAFKHVRKLEGLSEQNLPVRPIPLKPEIKDNSMLIPDNLVSEFLKTCTKELFGFAILGGRKIGSRYVITHIFKTGRNNLDLEKTINVNEKKAIREELEKLGLLPIGWICTDIWDNVVMSTAELHIQYAYQLQIDVSVGISVPTETNKPEVFQLTPLGMEVISQCRNPKFNHDHVGYHEKQFYQPPSHVSFSRDFRATLFLIRRDSEIPRPAEPAQKL